MQNCNLSLHDALPILAERGGTRKFIYASYSGNLRLDSPLETAKRDCEHRLFQSGMDVVILRPTYFMRSEEHTSELQSHSDLVCRLLLEKKNGTWRPMT